MLGNADFSKSLVKKVWLGTKKKKEEKSRRFNFGIVQPYQTNEQT